MRERRRQAGFVTDREGGFTLLEITVGMLVLSLVLGGVCGLALGTYRLFSNQMSHVYLEQTGARLMDRLTAELRSAYPPSITPVAIAGSTWIRYQQVTGYAGGVLGLGPFATLRFELAPNETDNDVDDNGDGLADDGFLTYTPDAGATSRIAGNVLAVRFDSTPAGLLLSADVALVDYRGDLVQRTYTREICFRNPD